MTTAIIACGALAREILALIEKHRWDAEILAVASLFHNTPDRIAPAVRERIREAREKFDHVVVAYGDCGTRGELDALLEAEGVRRLVGPHCYEMYAQWRFEEMMADEPGTFFLTDYMVRSFDHLILEGLGIDRRPELRDDYFGNYRRVVYLAQEDDPALRARAQWAADQLALPLQVQVVGYGALESRLASLVERGEE